jgi:protoheme IX farnesyltransferase
VLLAVAVSRSADDSKGDRPARQLFGYSILYLFVIFTLLIVDRAPGILSGSGLSGSGLSGILG